MSASTLICRLTAAALAAATWSSAEGATRVTLARDGNALVNVVVAEQASERVRQAASDLATYLGRISGATFDVQVGDGTVGVAVGVATDFAALGLAEELAVSDVPSRERYVLKSHRAGLHAIGATELATEHAVWDLLYRLGYRQFFPGKTWEVVPEIAELGIALDVDEQPDYYSRRIWYGYGVWDYNRAPYAEWCARNRALGGFQLRTGHAYGGLIRRNRTAFIAQPEFYGLIKGERKSSKVCIGNPGLRKLIADYAIRCFEKDPSMDSVSMDPSDGGGWCECEDCAALGSVSDRALTLANQVAGAINERFQDKYVGMYAYGFHSPPPNIRVHPNVIISVATGFIKGGYTIDELISGWAKQGARLGIREYYDVNTWSRDLPGKPRGSNLEYLTRTIPDFYAKGARFMSAESGDCWGPCGLGYYVAARMLWDIDEAKQVDALVDDFLTRAFGPAKDPMKEFYSLIDGASNPRLSDHLLGKMYRLLSQAKELARSPAIRARIDDLTLYTRYVELYRAYSNARGDDRARQEALETLIRHAYRMRRTMMVHTKALYRDLVNRDKKVSVPAEAAWQIPESKNPWKSSEPFAEEELQGYVSRGMERYKTADFDAVQFSTELVPASPLELPEVKIGSVGGFGRGKQAFYTWVHELPKVFELKVTGGLIKHYRDRGNAKVDLWQIDGEREVPVAHGETAPDGVERTITLNAKALGLHKLTVSDGSDATKVVWEPGTPMTVKSGPERAARLSTRWYLYFYVPKGTRILGFYGSGAGALLDAEGQTVLKFDSLPSNYYSVPVPEGQDGRLWKFHHVSGRMCLMTVPPYLARSRDELLLPKEVVERDASGGD